MEAEKTVAGTREIQGDKRRNDLWELFYYEAENYMKISCFGNKI